LQKLKKYFLDLFPGNRFFISIGGLVALFVVSFYVPALQPVSIAIFFVFIIFCCVDYSLLFFTKRFPTAQRITPHRFSNGDLNTIDWIMKNDFGFPVLLEVID
jgi:hypothetical protein